MLSVNIEIEITATGTLPFRLQIGEDFSQGFTVLFGPSGAGKSTLLDCIAGLLKPDKGKITFGDEIFFDVERNVFVPPEKRGIGYVFQSLALFPHLLSLIHI